MRIPRVLLGACTALAAAASVAQPPRAVAELFGRGVFSTGDYELPPTFSRDGRTAYFTVSTPLYGRMRFIMETHLQGGRWSEPEVAPFSGQYDDADPYFSPDGSKLFFLSKRPVTPGAPPKRDLDIWVMERAGGGWGAPRHLGPRVNGPSDEHYVTMTNDGTLYIAAVRADSRNQGDLYRIPLVGGEYGDPENLGPTVNGAEFHDTTPWVAPDGSYVIFGSRGRSDSRGEIDLYITTRGADGQWTTPRNLGPGVNSPSTDYCPLVSPDGKWLYFSSTRHFADSALAAPLRARALRERIRSPGNTLGDTYRVPLAPLLAELGVATRAH